MKPIVLITGCSTGIGRALAVEYVKRGCLVYATARKITAIQDLSGPDLLIHALDVTNPVAIKEVMQRLATEQGRLDILVNNAGYAAIGPVVEMPAAELHRQFEVNVFSALALIQAALPLLLKSSAAKIVNIGSVSGVLTTPFAGAYCAAKASLHKLSDALRMELAPFHINVMTVQPGAIRSDFGKNSKQQLAHTLQPQSLYEPVRQAIFFAFDSIAKKTDPGRKIHAKGRGQIFAEKSTGDPAHRSWQPRYGSVETSVPGKMDGSSIEQTF